MTDTEADISTLDESTLDETGEDETGEPAAQKTEPPPRKRRSVLRRLAKWVLLLVFGLMVGLVVAVFSLVGRPVTAPEWVNARITQEINAGLPGLQVSLGGVDLLVETDWQPRVRLRDVVFSDDQGRKLLNLADLNTALSGAAALRGEIRPSRVWLDGVQMTLRRGADGQFGLSFGEVAPTWTAANPAQLIDGLDGVLVQPALADLTELSVEALTVRYEDARAGRAWTVDGGRVELTREGDDLTLRGDLALLGGGDTASTIEMNYASRIGSPEAAFGMSFQELEARDIAEQSAALLWLGVIKAPISGALRASTDAEGDLGPLSATLQIGQGVLQPTEGIKPIPFTGARSYFTYDPGTQIIQFDEMSVDSAWGQLQSEGKVIVGDLQDGWPEDFLGQMRLSALSLNPAGFYPEPIRFENATADVRLELDPFRLTLGQVTLRDEERRLILSGELTAPRDGWKLSLDGHLNQLDTLRLLQLWPVSVVARTRDWIDRNVLTGKLHNIQLAVRSKPGHKPETHIGFEFSEFDTLFMKTMPPVRGARGHAVLAGKTFTVQADAGIVRAEQGGALNVAGTTFVVPDVKQKPAPAQVRLAARGTITAALSLLDREPFRFLSKSNLPVTLADGRADIGGTIDFRLKKNLPPNEVQYQARAVLTNVRSDKIVPGRVLSAPDIRVTANREALKLSGDGRLGAVPVSGSFTAPLGPAGKGRSTVEGRIELSQRFVDEFRVGLPPGTVAGKAWGDVRIDMTRGQPAKFTMSSALSGLALKIPPIGWAMSKRARGKLVVSGLLGDPVQVDKVSLDAPGLRATGRVELGAGGVFKSASFDRVRAGSWLDTPVSLIGRGAGKAPEVRVTGGWIDLSQTEIGSGEGSGGSAQSGPIKVTLDRLKISEGIALTSFRGEFSTARGMDGSFAGRVNGGASVTGRVLPRNGRSAFRILSNDAGGVFKSSGLLKNAAGGSLDLTLIPAGKAGIYNGLLKAAKVRLRDAPAMAALLNAVSVVGLLEQLDGGGILFTEVEANFQMTPTRVAVTKGSAVGASMGISMDGTYDLGTGGMDFQGVVSPLYLLNGIGSVLTRKGEGLVGFSYKLVGTPDRPKVKVNPLSILTPGMFREIFRKPPPKVTQ